jgi:hypothetical protein
MHMASSNDTKDGIERLQEPLICAKAKALRELLRMKTQASHLDLPAH